REPQAMPIQLAFSEAPAKPVDSQIYPSLGLHAEMIEIEHLADRDVEVAIIALGFEDRAVQSAKRLLGVIRPRRLVLVQYDDSQGRKISEDIDRLKIPATRIRSHQELTRELRNVGREVIIDASGLSKPFLFIAARDGLRGIGRLTVVHTLAEE